MKYRFIELIGSGAFARVYKATTTTATEDPQAWVAVKVIEKPSITTDQEMAVRREAALMQRLHHPNILQILEFIEAGDKFLLVSEFMECDLFNHVSLGPLMESVARHVVTQLLRALEYLHDQCGVVHRDVKLENVLTSYELNESSPVKLCDFGLSKEIHSHTTATPCGTMAYSAPEVQRALKYNASIDDWALGCLMYSCLSATPPFYDSARTPMRMRIVRGDYDFVGASWEGVSAEAKDMICGLLDVNQQTRLSTANALRHPWILRQERELSELPYLAQHTEQVLKRHAQRSQAGWSPIASGTIFRTPVLSEFRDYFDRGLLRPQSVSHAQSAAKEAETAARAASQTLEEEPEGPVDVSALDLATPPDWRPEGDPESGFACLSMLEEEGLRTPTLTRRFSPSERRASSQISQATSQASQLTVGGIVEGLGGPARPVAGLLGGGGEVREPELERARKEARWESPLQQPLGAQGAGEPSQGGRFPRLHTARFVPIPRDFAFDIGQSRLLHRRAQRDPGYLVRIMSLLVHYMEPEELRALVQGSRTPQDYLVVDVRDDDFQFGNIPHALHAPSRQFLEDPTPFLPRLAASPLLIFHCALSQVRGPKCAQRYATLRNLERERGSWPESQGEEEGASAPGSPPQQQRVLVLRGGFEEWQRRFKQDPALVEHYDEEYWLNPW